MALELVISLQVDYSGESWWMVENSGAYDSQNNVGGWGTPNPEKVNSALVVYAERQSNPIEVIGSPTSVIYYDAAADNTDEVTIQLTHAADGWVKLWVYQMPAYDTVGASGAGLLEGQHFYNYENAQVEITTASGFDAVADYSTLSIDNTLTSIFAEELFTMQLREKARELYIEYTTARDECMDDVKEKFRAYLTLTQDIQGLDYAFYGGLTTEAHDATETLLKKYDLI